MIDYGSFVFAAAPRTGSTWFAKAAAAAGLGEAFKAHLHTKASKSPSRLSVSLVRHPCEWLASYYHVLRGGHTGVPEVDLLSSLAHDCISFDEFVHGVVRNFPGQVSAIMLSYDADSYIRTCDLDWACYELFTASGVHHRTAMVATAEGPQNQGRYEVQWSPILWQRVVESEPIVDQFEFEL